MIVSSLVALLFLCYSFTLQTPTNPPPASIQPPLSRQDKPLMNVHNFQHIWTELVHIAVWKQILVPTTAYSVRKIPEYVISQPLKPLGVIEAYSSDPRKT